MLMETIIREQGVEEEQMRFLHDHVKQKHLLTWTTYPELF